MKTTLPPLTWFRSFEAAARTLSFTAAAEEIGMTQSAVSQQIKALETRLHTLLFHRRPRGLALTDAGRKLLPEVEAALETLASATERHLGRPSDTGLSVAASVSMLEWVIAPRLTEFQARHPECRISFHSTIWPDEYSASSADLEIRFGSARQVGAGAVALPDLLLPVKAPDLPGTVADLPLIEAVGTSVGWAAWGRQAGQEGLTPSLMVDSYGLALKLALEGAGVALVNTAIAAETLASGRLQRAHEQGIPGKETYYLSRRSERPMAMAFADWLTALLAEP